MEWLKSLIKDAITKWTFEFLRFLFPDVGEKRKKKIEIKSKYAEKRVETLKRIIRFEKKANVIEDINLAHPELFNSGRVKPGENGAIYMSIVENRENLNDFWNELKKIRKEEEPWISCRVAAYLLYCEKYIVDFLKFLAYIEYEENDLYIFGLLLASDIQKWQRKFDKVLVYELNDVSFEIESQSGDEWKYEKENLEEEYTKTILYKLIQKTDGELMKLMCAIFVNYSINIAEDIDKMDIVARRLKEEGYLGEVANE